MPDFYDLISQRRSIRSFESTPVPDELLRRALSAAQLAPSSLDSQPWHFFVTKGDARDRVLSMVAGSTRLLWDIYPMLDDEYLEKGARFFSELGGAPVVVVVTVNRQADDLARKMAILATGGAVYALQLALAAEGLASVCIASATWIEEEMSSELRLENHEVVTVLPVGYPAEEPAPRPARVDRVTWLEEWPERSPGE